MNSDNFVTRFWGLFTEAVPNWPLWLALIAVLFVIYLVLKRRYIAQRDLKEEADPARKTRRLQRTIASANREIAEYGAKAERAENPSERASFKRQELKAQARRDTAQSELDHHLRTAY